MNLINYLLIITHVMSSQVGISQHLNHLSNQIHLQRMVWQVCISHNNLY